MPPSEFDAFHISQSQDTVSYVCEDKLRRHSFQGAALDMVGTKDVVVPIMEDCCFMVKEMKFVAKDIIEMSKHDCGMRLMLCQGSCQQRKAIMMQLL